MADKGPKIGDLLVQAGMIDQMQLRAALGHQKRWGGKIGKVLVDLGFIEEEVMLRFLSERFRMKAVNLMRSRITPQTFESVPENLAKKYQVVPVILREVGGKKTIVLAMNDPSDLRAIDEITFMTGAKIEPVLATDSAIAKVLARYGDFTPEGPKESSYQEQATPSKLRQERQDPSPAAKAATSRPAPPAVTSQPPRPAPRPVAPEPNLDATSSEDLELVKGEVTMLKTMKPRRPDPHRTTIPPARPRPDSSPILGRESQRPTTASGSPILGHEQPRPAAPGLGRPTASPPDFPEAPDFDAPPAVDEAPVLPDIAPLPDSDTPDSNVLLSQPSEPPPPAMDGPAPAFDFIDDAAQAAATGDREDIDMEIPDAGEEMQMADAYEFIPPAPEPEAELPDRPLMVPDDPYAEPEPAEPAGPPPFDAETLPPSFDEAHPPDATTPPEMEWGPGDDFFSMPVPGGITDKPRAIPDIPSKAVAGEMAASPFDEEWPEPPAEPVEMVEPVVEILSSTEAPALEEIPAIDLVAPVIPTLSEELLGTAPEAPTPGNEIGPDGRRQFVPMVSDAPPMPADDLWGPPPSPPAPAAPSPPPPPAPLIAPPTAPPAAAPPPLPDADSMWQTEPKAPAPTAAPLDDPWAEPPSIEPALAPEPPPVVDADPWSVGPAAAAPAVADAPPSLWEDAPAPLAPEPATEPAPAPASAEAEEAVPDASVNLWDEMAATDEPNQELSVPAALEAPAMPEAPDEVDPFAAEPFEPPPAAESAAHSAHDPGTSLWDAPAPPPAVPPATSEWHVEEQEDLWGGAAASPAAAPPDLPPLPDLDWMKEPEPSSLSAEPAAWDELEPAAPRPMAPMPSGTMELQVEEIDMTESDEAAPSPVSALPFEGPPPGSEDLPTIEAMPLANPAESHPSFEVISEAVDPFALNVPTEPASPVPPVPDLDEQVSELPAYDRTVLKMSVTVEDDKSRAELPEMVLMPSGPRPEPPPLPEPPAPPADAFEFIPPVVPLEPPPAPPAASTAAPKPPVDELKLLAAAMDEDPSIDSMREELERLDGLGGEFLDTREVRDKLSKISELETEVRQKEFQFDDLLSLMMKKELGEITQELFMKELQVLKKKVDHTRRKDEK